MSLADELLESIASDDSVNYAAGSTFGQHIIINDDRTVVVPEDLKRIAVQFDHNIETVTFDCPRYWDGLDMSQLKVYVNYIRSDNKTGSYPTEVTSADETTMHFDWTISSDVTQVKGKIAFLICVKKVVDGEEVNHWNSELCRDCYISEGLEAEAAISNEHPDIITQLLQKVNALEKMLGDTIAVEVIDDVLYLKTHLDTVKANIFDDVLYLTKED